MGEYRNGKWYEDAAQKASGDYHWEKDRDINWRWKYETAKQRINELEQWIAALADDHKQIPDWIQQSARSLLAQESK